MPRIALTKHMLSQSRVIARGRGIRGVARLVRAYGGNAGTWTKRSTRPLSDQSGRFEYHWYEHHGVGRFEIKRVTLGVWP
jgi:hypothetical protein